MASDWKHVKRGTVYREIGRALVQDAAGRGIREGDTAVVYQGEDGQMWVREVSEFEDGRFVEAAPTPKPAGDYGDLVEDLTDAEVYDCDNHLSDLPAKAATAILSLTAEVDLWKATAASEAEAFESEKLRSRELSAERDAAVKAEDDLRNTQAFRGSLFARIEAERDAQLIAHRDANAAFLAAKADRYDLQVINNRFRNDYLDAAERAIAAKAQRDAAIEREGRLREALEPFLDIGPQRGAWGVISKQLDGMAPLTVTVTKAQMLAAWTALASTAPDSGERGRP